ncbi:MAG: hypothetical protein QGG53_16890 [Planctomycetota bacterium]|jgi:hypothetical protein|nr:hypothetical protein [Planctomycetota bacterium]
MQNKNNHRAVIEFHRFILCLVPALIAPIHSESTQQSDQINPMGTPKLVADGKPAFRIAFVKGTWRMSWGSSSKQKYSWHGRVDALDGTWILAGSKRMEIGGKDKRLGNNMKKLGKLLTFRSTTSKEGDNILFESDARKFRFTIYQGDEYIHATRVFIGHEGRNPSKVPFVLTLPEENENREITKKRKMTAKEVERKAAREGRKKRKKRE